MEPIMAANGQLVTEEMINKWSAEAELDEWPEGDYSWGPIIHGAPRALSSEETVTLSVKIPIAMKRAIEAEAKNEQITTSELVRSMLFESLLAAS